MSRLMYYNNDLAGCGLVAQRIRRLTTDQEIAGSNPAEIDYIFFHCFREKQCILPITYNFRKLRLVFRLVLMCVQEFSEQRFFAFISLCAD